MHVGPFPFVFGTAPAPAGSSPPSAEGSTAEDGSPPEHASLVAEAAATEPQPQSAEAAAVGAAPPSQCRCHAGRRHEPRLAQSVRAELATKPVGHRAP